MQNILIIIYIIGFLGTLWSEMMLGDRWYFALPKALLWPLWRIVLAFHKTNKNT